MECQADMSGNAAVAMYYSLNINVFMQKTRNFKILLLMSCDEKTLKHKLNKLGKSDKMLGFTHVRSSMFACQLYQTHGIQSLHLQGSITYRMYRVRNIQLA